MNSTLLSFYVLWNNGTWDIHTVKVKTEDVVDETIHIGREAVRRICDRDERGLQAVGPLCNFVPADE